MNSYSHSHFRTLQHLFSFRNPSLGYKAREYFDYPDGKEGNRGIFIDYDHAIRVADTPLYSTKRKIVRDQLGIKGFLLIQDIFLSRRHPYLCYARL